MSESDLDTELRLRAERTAEALLREARAEADRLVDEAEREVEKRRADALQDKEAEYRAEARLAIAAERHEALREVLEARSRVVDRVLDELRGILPEATTTESYLSSLSDEISDALQYVDGDGAVVRCSASLASAVQAVVQDRPQIRVEPTTDIDAGFVLAGAEGSVVVDGRLETRVDRLAPTLAIEIQRYLEEL